MFPKQLWRELPHSSALRILDLKAEDLGAAGEALLSTTLEVPSFHETNSQERAANEPGLNFAGLRGLLKATITGPLSHLANSKGQQASRASSDPRPLDSRRFIQGGGS